MIIKLFIFILLGSLLFPKIIYAQNIACSDRFLTLINPVRSRELWHVKSLKPFNDQVGILMAANMPATWLLQDDVLKDSEMLTTLEKLDQNQELGVFLEISENLTTESKVLYPSHTYWYNPKAVFLSGYTPTERRKLIDKIFNNFKSTFGYFPESVGAWWIDSYSLDYMAKNYHITSAIIVADQLSTDGYGIWGQWWGVPYYPNKINILEPASTKNEKVDVAILQWA